jgi:hypothetical protein
VAGGGRRKNANEYYCYRCATVQYEKNMHEKLEVKPLALLNRGDSIRKIRLTIFGSDFEGSCIS